MNVENNNDNSSSKTITSVISRKIKPGFEKDYDDWVLRYLELERKALGYLGTTIILPGGTSSNVRYIIRRFADRSSTDALVLIIVKYVVLPLVQN